jgi:hypothetical protein
MGFSGVHIAAALVGIGSFLLGQFLFMGWFFCSPCVVIVLAFLGLLHFCCAPARWSCVPPTPQCLCQVSWWRGLQLRLRCHRLLQFGICSFFPSSVSSGPCSFSAFFFGEPLDSPTLYRSLALLFLLVLCCLASFLAFLVVPHFCFALVFFFGVLLVALQCSFS